MVSSKAKKKNSDNYPYATRLKDLRPSSLKEAAASQVEDVIDLASGAPFLPTPEALKQGASTAILDDQNQYGNPWGDLILRTNIANRLLATHEKEVDPMAEITITNGSSSAIAAALMAIVNPGDEVIVFEPCYESYLSAIKLAGGVVQFVSLSPEDWAIRLDELEEKFSEKTKAVILNTPHNPTGKIVSREAIDYLLDLCEENDAFLVSDEIYSNLVFEGNTHSSPYAVADNERVILVNGLSKTYNVSGWRIGYLVASPQITEAIRLVHSTFGLAAPTPLQIAARSAFEDDSLQLEETAEHYQQNMNLLINALTEAGVSTVRPQGSAFLFADFSDLDLGELSARDYLLEKTGILALGAEAFFPVQSSLGKKYLRFCYAREKAVIEDACQRLESLQQS